MNVDSMPKGHMQPLGAHRDPDPVPEFALGSYPTPEDFWKKFVKPAMPAVFRGGAKSFGGYTKWTDDYLVKEYGDLELRLEGKKEKFGRTPYGVLGVGRDTMEHFINAYHNPDYKGYIVTELPVPMYHEAGVLPFMTCGTFKNRMVEVDLWINGGNASSVLHKDAYHTMNCLINGTKDWKLISLSEEKNIYKAWEAAPAFGGYSKINVNAVNMTKYPKVANVPWQFTKIEKGDCLFLPKGMYHNVVSYGTHNLAVALLFSRFDRYKRKDIDLTECANTVIGKESVPLSEFIVDWMYAGKGDLSMGNNDLENVRMQLLQNTNKAGILTLKRLTLQVRSIFSEKNMEFVKDYASKSYNYLSGGKGEITKDMIRQFSKKQLRVAAMCFERVHPTNADWNEYNHISPDVVKIALKKLLKKNEGQVSREMFLKLYDGLEGSPVFGNRFFDVVAGKGQDEVDKKQFKAKLKEALQPYYDHQVEGEEAAEPDVYRNNKRPEGYDEGDVDKMAQADKAERDQMVFQGDGDEEDDNEPEEEDDEEDGAESQEPKEEEDDEEEGAESQEPKEDGDDEDDSTESQKPKEDGNDKDANKRDEL
eukprot:gene6809-7578_t